MNRFIQQVQIRWSDLDPNFHLRHSVYYDWGAFCRLLFFYQHGLTKEVMQQLQFGPILFREECNFRKEITSGDSVSIDLILTKSKNDFSRWTIQHHIYKNENILAAVITVDGAWMDLIKRKLASPPEQVHHVFSAMPKTDAFQWLA